MRMFRPKFYLSQKKYRSSARLARYIFHVCRNTGPIKWGHRKNSKQNEEKKIEKKIHIPILGERVDEKFNHITFAPL